MHDIYRKKRILHHDISMRNLAYYKGPDGRPVATLIDFDLATMPPLVEAASEVRIGTVAFMARELLLIPDCDYGLHHDYESLFYCAIWNGLGYETRPSYPCQKGSKDDILIGWRTGSFCDMGHLKNCFIMTSHVHKIVEHIQDKTYADKCLNMCEQFGRATQAFSRMTQLLQLSKLNELQEPLEAKMTYAILIRALGRFDVLEDCKEPCCTPPGLPAWCLLKK